MKGYEVVTSDDEKVGEVVGESGDNLIVQHGSLFKSRRALPRAFAHADDTAHVVRTTISKQLLEESPKIEGDDDIDERAVAQYYGLAAGEDHPSTQGLGVVNPDDPARTADDDAHAAGLPSGDEQRMASLKHVTEGDPHPTSPSATAADRFSDFDDRNL